MVRKSAASFATRQFYIRFTIAIGIILPVQLLLVTEFFLNAHTYANNDSEEFTLLSESNAHTKRYLPSPLDDDGLFQVDAIHGLVSHRDTSSDDETFSSMVFPQSVKVLHHKEWDCPEYRTWDVVRSAGGKMQEMLQEKGFVKFLMESHFPRVEHWSLDNVSQTMVDHDMVAPKDSLVFLPFCAYSNSSIGIEGGSQKWKRERRESLPGMAQSDKKWGIFEAMLKPKGHQPFFINQQVFWVTPHPLMIPFWGSTLRNARTLRIDDTVQFTRGDVIIPISVEEQHCPLELPERTGASRKRLLFGCGREHGHSWRYPGWRAKLFDRVQAVKHPAVFARTSMSLDEYNGRFFQSKFCFVVPGDTIGTSQATRALCGGCVPKYMF